MKSIKFTTLILLASCQLLFGQNIKRAEKLYDDFGYKSTVSIYEKELLKNNTSLSDDLIRQIANSYRLFHDTQNSEKWYAQLIENTSDPEDYLHYAQVLHSNGKLDLASEYYLKYDSEFGDKDERGKILAQAIKRMDFENLEGVTIKNERQLNTKKIEFSPSFYGDGIVYVTTNAAGLTSNRDIWLDDNYMSLFQSERKENGQLGSPTKFASKLSSRFHEGPVSFSKSGDQIIFTKSSYSKGRKKLSKDGVLKLQIFTALRKKDKWTKPFLLPFNSEESDEVHPSLSADGQKLYFSSDRKGGYGGMDLYVSNFKNGTWNDPINLGPAINTAGNEVFPFIHDDGTLYFSSEGHAGYGGLDIYSSVNFENEWTAPVNMGAPFNSRMDDLGFIINVLNSEGYFSSDRGDGIGKDDIYSFQVVPEELKKPIITRLNAEICTVNKYSNNQVGNVTVIVSENIHFGDEDDEKYTTDNDGNLTLKLDSDKAYKFRAEKNGYLISEKVFSTEGISDQENISFCLEMIDDQNNCANLTGIVTNISDGSRIPNAIIAITNKCTGTLTTVSSNLLGEFDTACLPCDCVYAIQGIKNGYNQADDVIDLGSINCDNAQSVYYNIQLRSVNDDLPYAGTSTINKSSDPNSIALSVGTSIVFEDIYYDFDKYNIRPDAALILDKLSGLLRAYPAMEIELSAHTDSRGEENYNYNLSDNRALSAKRYLLSNGISSHRITSVGNGESLLRNRCDDGITCSEAQHQYNRRTEVKITNLGGVDPNLLSSISYQEAIPAKAVLVDNNERPNSITTSEINTAGRINNINVVPIGDEFKIQIFSSTSAYRDFRNLNDLGKVEKEIAPGTEFTRYLVSGSGNYQEAMALLPEIRRRGYKRAYIVTYNGGKRVHEMPK